MPSVSELLQRLKPFSGNLQPKKGVDTKRPAGQRLGKWHSHRHLARYRVASDTANARAAASRAEQRA